MVKKLILFLLISFLGFGVFASSKPKTDAEIRLEQIWSQQFYQPSGPQKIKIIADVKNGWGELDNVECGELIWDGKKWKMNLRVGVFGVNAFNRTSPEEIKKTRQWQIAQGEPHPIQDSYFSHQKSPASFEEIPELANLIRNQLQKISESFSTDFIETRFEVFFINEKNLVKKSVWESSQTISDQIRTEIFKPAVQRKISHQAFLPLNYMAIPSPSMINPGEGDPYTWSEYMAHEVFHLISRDHKNDGFIYGNYPLRGVMNNGNSFQILRKHGLSSQLLALEFNTLIVNQAAFQYSQDLYKVAVQKAFQPNYYTETGLALRIMKEAPLLPFYELQRKETDSKIRSLSEEAYEKIVYERLEKKLVEKKPLCSKVYLGP